MAQEGPPALLVVLPCILSIENNGDQRVPPLIDNRAAVRPDFVQEMLGGGVSVHPRINEPNQIAQVMVAEQDMDLPAVLLPQIGLVCQRWSRRLVERARQHTVIGRNPSKA